MPPDIESNPIDDAEEWLKSQGAEGGTWAQPAPLDKRVVRPMDAPEPVSPVDQAQEILDSQPNHAGEDPARYAPINPNMGEDPAIYQPLSSQLAAAVPAPETGHVVQRQTPTPAAPPAVTASLPTNYGISPQTRKAANLGADEESDRAYLQRYAGAPGAAPVADLEKHAEPVDAPLARPIGSPAGTPTNAPDAGPIGSPGEQPVNASTAGMDHSPSQQELEAIQTDAATKNKVDHADALALADTENRPGKWNPEAVSPKGARGTNQIMPSTALDLRVNPDDLHQNADGGVRYYGQLLQKFGGDKAKAAAAYNAGPGALDKALKANGGDFDKALASLKPETQDYVKNFKSNLEKRSGQAQPAAAEPTAPAAQPAEPAAQIAAPGLFSKGGTLDEIGRDIINPARALRKGGGLDTLGHAMLGIPMADASTGPVGPAGPSGAATASTPPPPPGQAEPETPGTPAVPGDQPPPPPQPGVPGLQNAGAMAKTATAADAAGVSTQTAGLQNAANAEGQQGLAESQAYSDVAKGLGTAAATEQQQQADIYKHVTDMSNKWNVINDKVMNNHIDPERAWSSRSAGQKALGYLGIFLSGLSGSDTNAALDIMQGKTKADVDAQKADLENQRGGVKEIGNLYSQMLDLYKSVPVATEATQRLLLNQSAAHLASIAATWKDPAAQARAAQLIGALQQSAAGKGIQYAQQALAATQAGQQVLGGQIDLSQKESSRRGFMKMLQGATSPTDPDVKAMEYDATMSGRLVPARVGDTVQKYVLPPGMTLSPGDRDRIGAINDVESELQKLDSFVNDRNTSAWSPEDRQQAASMASDLQQQIARAGGSAPRVSEGLKEFERSVIPDSPADFTSRWKGAHAGALASNQIHRNGILDLYGAIQMGGGGGSSVDFVGNSFGKRK